MKLTDAQRQAIVELRAERASLSSPIDRIVFDNQHDPQLPNLPVGLWLLAFKEIS